jgi:hypothetical protein
MLKRDEKGRYVGGKHDAATRQKISQGRREAFARQQELQADVPPIEFRRCTRCKKMKSIENDFHKIKRRLRNGQVREYPRSHCKDCSNENIAQWRAANPEAARKKNREASERRRKDPERWEKERKYQREYKRMERALKGSSSRGPWKKYRHELEEETSPMVDGGPFLEFWLSLNGDRPGEDLIGESCGRAIRRLMPNATTGEPESTRIQEAYVDKVGVVLKRPELLRTLYPEH